MLALFRNNQSTTGIWLALYVALLHLPAMLGKVPAPEGLTQGGGLLFQQLLGGWSENAVFSAVGAAVLVFIQALLINNLVDNYRMLEDRNWVPGMLYALAASSIPDFLFLTPALAALTFIPPALKRLFSVYKQNLAFGPAFDTAFWLALACLFQPCAAWFIIPAYLGFFNLRSFSFKEQIVFWCGIFVPVFLGFTFFFWKDLAGSFGNMQFNSGLQISLFSIPADGSGRLKYGLIGALLLIVLLGVNIYYFKKLIQVQKYITVLFWFLFAGLLANVLHAGPHPGYLLLLMPSVAVFLSYSFLSLRNYFMAEVFHAALVVAVFSLQYLFFV